MISCSESLLFFYFFSSVFGGYFAGRLYKTMKGQNWKKSALVVRLTC